jgi:hypothetical protein
MTRARWSVRLAGFLLGLLALLAAAEGLSYVFVRHVVNLAWQPNYLVPGGAVRFQGRWLTENQPWGAWHPPGARSRHQTACFAIDLAANSYGARDRERSRAGAERTVVLGDSFVEGFGVAEDRRLTNLLEKQTGREFLNFGASFDLGPLQYEILYDRLASGFEHDHVLIMFLPDNDFTDNDATHWRTRRGGEFARRYRPYYERTAEGWRAFYPVPAPPAEAAPPAAPPRRPAWYSPGELERALRNNSWTWRAIQHAAFSLTPGVIPSGYYDYTEEQLDAVLSSLAAIRRRAGDRQVTLAVIPRLIDFHRAAERGESPLLPRLRAFGEKHGIAVIDLLPAMRAHHPDPTPLFLACDGHWNETGNQAAAAALLASGRFPRAAP